MHACRFIIFGFFLLLSAKTPRPFCDKDDSFTILLCFNQGSAVSHRICKKWKVDKRDSCGTRGIGLLFGCHFALNMLNITTGVGSAHRVSTFSSGECGNAILQCCYCFNRLQLRLLAQGLLQSVLSLQVTVAMPYYSSVMVSID